MECLMRLKRDGILIHVIMNGSISVVFCLKQSQAKKIIPKPGMGQTG